MSFVGLDNCIGFWNYKFFLLTLFYGAVSLLLICASCGWLGWYILNHTNLVGLDVSRLALGLTIGIVCGIGALVIVMFLGMHVVMVAKGMTTIEMFEKSSAPGLEDDSCIRTLCCTRKDPRTNQPLYPASRYKRSSFYKNLKAAIGEDVMCWFIPTMPKMKTGSADGLTYETNKTDEDSVDSPLINPDE
jgi:hypothetical protein